MTQRGNRRGQVFFAEVDYHTYLKWLCQYSARHRLEVLAYCLMPNHVHLVAVPGRPDSLQRAIGQLHRRYAQNLNHHRVWQGHVWQGRYFSCPLDEPYVWAAIRYVERNPVKAGLAGRAEGYPWSSARAHCGLREDPVLSASASWQRQFDAIGDWSRWLAAGDSPGRIAELRNRTRQCMPCGSATFIETLEANSGRALRPQARGRPRAQG
ncbi:MAG: transposase [Gammaproteobacteria bacterium]